MTFKTYLYTNYWTQVSNVNACVCSGIENPPNTWEINPLIHTYKFNSNNWGMRIDRLDFPGSIGRIDGWPEELFGTITIKFENRGKEYIRSFIKYPTQQFNIIFTILLKQYYRIINSDTKFTITWYGSNYYYKSSTGQYAGLQNIRNGEENHLWTLDEWPLSGGVFIDYRNDSKDPTWILRMSLYINPDPPNPSYPSQYLDGPMGMGVKGYNADGLWPGLIREWIED